MITRIVAFFRRLLAWLLGRHEPEAIVSPAPDPEPIDPELDRVKRLAILIAGNYALGTLSHEVEDDIWRWLRTLDRTALCRVGCASDRSLRRHLRGLEFIAGVRPADKATVDEYVRSCFPRVKPPPDEFAGRGGGGGPKRMSMGRR